MLQTRNRLENRDQLAVSASDGEDEYDGDPGQILRRRKGQSINQSPQRKRKLSGSKGTVEGKVFQYFFT